MIVRGAALFTLFMTMTSTSTGHPGKEALHSTNLSSNRQTSFTIYDSSRKRGTNNYRCLYMTATVSIVENKSEAERAFQMLYPEDRMDLTDFLAQGLKRIYKATPQQAWLNCLSERELDTIDAEDAH